MTQQLPIRLWLGSMLCLAVLSCDQKPSAVAPFSPQVMARSRLDDGDLSRLQRVLAKARRGEPITIGVIGGSITRGERATSASHQYADLVAAWWQNHFPRSRITLVNAGISATGSNYGCLRVQRDLLSHQPDFVIVEFGVNDKEDLEHALTYEGVVRQIVADPHQPAVLLLFMMHHIGTNAQEFQGEIGRRYRLPMISYRDALWPEIQAGRLKLDDIFADTVHPNDRGHAAVATFINALLQDALDHLPKTTAVAAEPPLPPPRYSDFYSHTVLVAAADLQPTSSTGWQYDSVSHCLCSSTPGSAFEFEMNGRQIDLILQKNNGPYGIVSVTVDDGDPVQCDGFMEATWGSFPQTFVVAANLSPGKHTVRVELLAAKNPLSTGNHFLIYAAGGAGVLP